MWCKACQQDVPGVASAEGGAGICCARCRNRLDAPPTREPDFVEIDETGAPIAHAATTPPEWRSEFAHVDEDLRSAQRLIQALDPYRTSDHGRQRQRVDAPVASSAAASRRVGGDGWSPDRTPALTRQSVRRKPRSQAFGWIAMSFGMMGLAFGVVLLGWAVAMSRGDLWQIGLPVTFVSQAILIVGLIFLLDGLTKTNRDTSDTLEDLDEQLQDLRHATTMLSTTHSSPAQSFYAHYAGGASPKLLMADLKGQLDLLAQRLGDEQR